MINIFKKAIIPFIIIAFIFSVFLFSWKNFFTIEKTNSTTLKYEEIINNIELKKVNNLNQEENFIIQNNNIYGTLIAMLLAKKYILYNNLDKAFEQLNNSLKYTKEENLKNILKIRMAKIKMQKDENNKAIDIVKNIQNNNWNNIIENIKGDIFLKKNDKNKAIEHWKKSFFNESSNASKEIINMKINELKREK